MNLAALKSEVMKLDAQARESLTMFLVSSLEADTAQETEALEALWYQEAEQRYQAYQRGDIKGIPADVAFDEAFKEIQ